MADSLLMQKYELYLYAQMFSLCSKIELWEAISYYIDRAADRKEKEG